MKLNYESLRLLFCKLYHRTNFTFNESLPAENITNQAIQDAGDALSEDDFQRDLNALLIKMTSGSEAEIADKIAFADKAIRLVKDTIET